GVHRDGCDGGANLFSAEVSLAGEALSVYLSVAHRLLRRQRPSAGGLSDRRQSASTAAIQGRGYFVQLTAQCWSDRIQAGQRLAGSRKDVSGLGVERRLE